MSDILQSLLDEEASVHLSVSVDTLQPGPLCLHEASGGGPDRAASIDVGEKVKYRSCECRRVSRREKNASLIIAELETPGEDRGPLPARSGARNGAAVRGHRTT